MDILPYNDRMPLTEPPTIQVEEAAGANALSAATEQSTKIPQPEINIIVDGDQISKPGMKSIFVESDHGVIIGDPTVNSGSFCSCNVVLICTCEQVCSCESVCTCVGHCACNQVCSCDGHCSCDQVCTCNAQCTCQNRTVCTCNPHQYCSCVPVH